MSVPKHVWVDVTGGWGEYRRPGLLLEWRQRQHGAAVKWEALVAQGEGDAHSWRMATSWVLAEHVRPVEGAGRGSGRAAGSSYD